MGTTLMCCPSEYCAELGRKICSILRIRTDSLMEIGRSQGADYARVISGQARGLGGMRLAGHSVNSGPRKRVPGKIAAVKTDGQIVNRHPREERALGARAGFLWLDVSNIGQTCLPIAAHHP